MARLPLADPDALPPFLRDLHDGAAPSDWSTRHTARVFAAHPDLLEQYLRFYYPWHSNDGVGLLPARLKELTRLRIATLNGCQTCKAARLEPSVSDADAAGVDAPEGGFTDQELAAIHLAEAMAVDHFSINDAWVSALRQHFSTAQILELLMMIGQYLGLGRLLAILQLEDVVCPIDP